MQELCCCFYCSVPCPQVPRPGAEPSPSPRPHHYSSVFSLVPELEIRSSITGARLLLLCPLSPGVRVGTFTFSPGCADAIPCPWAQATLYSLILGSVLLLHTKSCTAQTQTLDPWESCKCQNLRCGCPSCSMCSFASGPRHDGGYAHHPALDTASRKISVLTWCQKVLSTRTSFHGQQRRTGHPQQPYHQGLQ